MASVTFPEALGGNGQTYTDDADPNTGLDGLGYTIRFIPCLQQAVVMGLSAKNDAQAAAGFVQQCQTLRQETATDRQAVAEDRAAVEQHLQDAQARIGTTQALIDARDTALAAQAGAEDAETGAVAAQTSAEAARDAAVVSGQVYPDTSAGLTATSDGQYFKTVAANQAGFLTLWRNNAGVATEIETYPSLTGIAQALEQANRKQTRLARSLQRLGDHGQTLHSDFDLDAHGLGTALVCGVQDALDSGELWTTVRETPTLAYQHVEDGTLKYVEVPPNVLARDWNPETGKYQAQMNGAVTNELLWSSKFDESVWVKNALDVVTQTVEKIKGWPAFRLVEDSSSVEHRVQQDRSVGTGRLAYFVIAKAGGRGSIKLGISDLTVSGVSASFDLLRLETTIVSAGSSWLEFSSFISDLGDGWVFCLITAEATAGATKRVYIYLEEEYRSSTTYQGDGTSGAYIAHAQLVQGSSPGPVIVTAGTPVTRAADNIYRERGTEAGITGETFILDYTPVSSDGVRFGASNGVFSNSIYISNNLVSFRQNGAEVLGVSQVETLGQRRCVGLAISSGNSAISRNGDLIERDNEFTHPEYNVQRLGQVPWGGINGPRDVIIHNYRYIPFRVPNELLQELTAL